MLTEIKHEEEELKQEEDVSLFEEGSKGSKNRVPGPITTREDKPEVRVIYYTDGNGKKRKKVQRLVRKKKELTRAEEEEIKTAFNMFDKDGSGNIDLQEMRDAMKALGVFLSKDEVKAMMASVDTDGNGFVDYDEFRNLIKGFIKNRNKVEELKRAFRIYDEDDTGLIEFDDLRRVANELEGGEVTDDEIREMLYEATRDRNGTVNID